MEENLTELTLKTLDKKIDNVLEVVGNLKPQPTLKPFNTTMDEEAIKLFTSNYNNEGLCESLDEKMKVIEKEFKKTGVTKHIQYLPWAIVERIFRMQGGTIEIIDWKYAIKFEKKEYNPDSGEIEDINQESLFIHLRATWKGVTLDEFYPIFNNQTSRVVSTPDSQQLNTSRQRGSVRLIARLSGIGLWIFEQQEDEDSPEGKLNPPKKIETPTNEPKEPNISKSKKNQEDIDEEIAKNKELEEEKKAKRTLAEQRKKDREEKKNLAKETKDEAMTDLLGEENIEEELIDSEDNVANMLLGGVPKEDEKELEKPRIPTPATTFEIGSEEHADLILRLKGHVPNHRERIIEFKNSKNRAILADLTYEELLEILNELD